MTKISDRISKLHDLGSRNWDRGDMDEKRVKSSSNFKGQYNRKTNCLYNEAIAREHLKQSLAIPSVKKSVDCMQHDYFSAYANESKNGSGIISSYISERQNSQIKDHSVILGEPTMLLKSHKQAAKMLNAGLS